jgi:uncharacterized damage-inducible protein DinB
MTTRDRLISLFDKLYQGSPWIDVNIKETLKDITAVQASKRVLKDCNTIWEITNHLVQWRLNVLQRVQGKIMTTPAHNYIQRITENSDEAWAATLDQFSDTQEEWNRFLLALKEEDLEKVYPVNEMTYYEHIQGIIQHDAYHLGQIVLLKKLL